MAKLRSKNGKNISADNTRAHQTLDFIIYVIKMGGWLITKDWSKFNEKRCSVIKTDQFTPNDVSLFREEAVKVFSRNGWIFDEVDFGFYKIGKMMENMSCLETIFFALKKIRYRSSRQIIFRSIKNKIRYMLRAKES